MHSYKSVIQEAELLAASPEFVAEFLRKRAVQSNTEAQNDPVNEEVEHTLRSRADPLINLGLARYSRYYSTVRPLFENAPPGDAIRLAILSNTSISLWSLSHFPMEPFSSGLFPSEQEAVQWINQATLEELHALFGNPTVAESFLRDVLQRSATWNGITDDQLVRIVGGLVSNLRMRAPQEDEFVDGWADYDYASVFDAAWKLAGLVEPTQDWAIVLGYLYEQMVPEAFSLTEPLSLVTRWQSGPSDATEGKEQVEFSWKQRVRKGLGRLALSKNSDLFPTLLNNGDLALRCAAYAYGELTPDQLTAAYGKDGEVVLAEAKNNIWLWHSAQGRAALKTLASADDDKHSWSQEGYIYNRMYEDMQRSHPEWFKDADYHEKVFDGDDLMQVDKLEYAANVEESKAAQHLGKTILWSICVAFVLVLGTEASHRLLGFPSDTKFVPITAVGGAVAFVASTYWTTILRSRALRLNEFRIRVRQIDRRLMEIETKIESQSGSKHLDGPK